MDVEIYREAARTLLSGEDLYAGRYGPQRLPFTYPPAAAIAFIPLALMPSFLAAGALFAVSLVALLLSIRWSHVYALASAQPPWWSTCLLAVAAAFLLEPVGGTLGFGQVNLVLMALIMGIDGRATRKAGFGAGTAAALKVTPVLLVVAQSVRGDWRAFTRGLAAVAVLSSVAFLLLPSQTIDYFETILWDAQRTGNLDYIGNQSWRGFLERHVGGDVAALWLVGVLVIAALGFYAVRRHRADAWFSLSIAAVVGLLVSPISWNHHWVWMIPCLAISARYGVKSLMGIGGLAMVLAVVVMSVDWMIPAVPSPLADPYVVAGIVWLLCAVGEAVRHSRKQRTAVALLAVAGRAKAE
jgi:alpha-1,2-mannosyltransferase